MPQKSCLTLQSHRKELGCKTPLVVRHKKLVWREASKSKGVRQWFISVGSWLPTSSDGQAADKGWPFRILIDGAQWYWDVVRQWNCWHLKWVFIHVFHESLSYSLNPHFLFTLCYWERLLEVARGREFPDYRCWCEWGMQLELGATIRCFGKRRCSSLLF